MKKKTMLAVTITESAKTNKMILASGIQVKLLVTNDKMLGHTMPTTPTQNVRFQRQNSDNVFLFMNTAIRVAKNAAKMSRQIPVISSILPDISPKSKNGFFMSSSRLLLHVVTFCSFPLTEIDELVMSSSGRSPSGSNIKSGCTMRMIPINPRDMLSALILVNFSFSTKLAATAVKDTSDILQTAACRPRGR